MMESVYCYNTGCGQKFDPSNNPEGSCRYHASKPVFHDEKKKWPCCKKSSSDFSDFLKIPGCTTGKHNPVKPPDSPKPVRPVQEEKEVIIVKGHLPNQIVKERPSQEEELQMIKYNVGASLVQALEKLSTTCFANGKSVGDQNSDSSAEVPIGMACQNNGCRAKYVNPDSNKEICNFHSGVPIFHEGMKFWTCCQRKTSDFDAFMEQEGCTQGRHCWTKKNVIKTCRVDWHQTASFVTISLFAKTCIPSSVKVQANRVICRVCFDFEAGQSQFDRQFTLCGIIDPSESHVQLLGSKVEINLKKAEAESWIALELPQQSLS